MPDSKSTSSVTSMHSSSMYPSSIASGVIIWMKSGGRPGCPISISSIVSHSPAAGAAVGRIAVPVVAPPSSSAPACRQEQHQAERQPEDRSGTEHESCDPLLL